MTYFNFLAVNSSAILTGIVVTLQIYSLSIITGTLAAFVIAFLLMAPFGPVRWITTAYVELIRGTPLLIQLFWLFYVLPLFGIYLDKNVTGVVCLAANLSAFGSGVVKGAIESIPRGQWEASVALNLSPIRRMRDIILPQAVLLLFPIWGNLLVEYLKHSSLVSLVAITDVMYQMKMINNNTFDAVQSFGTALLIYYLISRLIITPLFRMLERYWGRRIGVG